MARIEMPPELTRGETDWRRAGVALLVLCAALGAVLMRCW